MCKLYKNILGKIKTLEIRNHLLKILGLLLIFNILSLTPASSSSRITPKDLGAWKCAVPSTVYTEVQISSREDENEILSKLLQEEKKDLKRNPKNKKEIQSSYNTLYGKWAEQCSNSWFTEAKFKAYMGKTNGDQGFDGFYIVNYSPEQRFVVINEVKFNKSRLTRAKCYDNEKCRCGQMSRNWIENNAHKLTSKSAKYYEDIQFAIRQGNYCRSLVNVDIEGNLYFFKLTDQYCLGTRLCQRLQNKEAKYFKIVKNALASVVPLNNG